MVIRSENGRQEKQVYKLGSGSLMAVFIANGRDPSLRWQSVSVDILLPQGMTDLEVVEPADQWLRFFVELAEVWIFHFVDALHLADHELGITDNLERLDPVLDRVTKHS